MQGIIVATCPKYPHLSTQFHRVSTLIKFFLIIIYPFPRLFLCVLFILLFCILGSVVVCFLLVFRLFVCLLVLFVSLSGFVYKDYFVCFCLFRFSIALYGLVCPFDHLQLTRILNRNFKAYQLQRQRKAKSENIRGLTQIMVTPSLSNVLWVVISYQILTCFSSQSVKYLVMKHYCHFTDVSLYKSKQHFTRNQYIHE